MYKRVADENEFAGGLCLGRCMVDKQGRLHLRFPMGYAVEPVPVPLSPVGLGLCLLEVGGNTGSAGLPDRSHFLLSLCRASQPPATPCFEPLSNSNLPSPLMTTRNLLIMLL